MPTGPEAIWDRVLASSPDAVVVADEAGVVRAVSPAVTTLFGYSHDEIVGGAVEILVPDAVRARHRDHRKGFTDHPVARPMGRGLDLYGRRSDGTVFPVDVSLAPLHLGDRLWTAAFVRDATDRRRTERLMGDINEVTQRILGATPMTEVLEFVSARACALVGATASWVVMPDDRDRDRLHVVAAAGPGGGLILGSTLRASSSLSGRAMGTSRALVVADMQADPLVVQAARDAGFGPGAYLPMVTPDSPIGALVIARAAGQPAFSQAEVDVAEVFASATAVGVALDAARGALEELHLVSEHERIARDLHDTVIQRLFALGMGLRAAERLADAGVAERITAVVRGLDEVIREIRETIFDLNRPRSESLDVRQQVREVVSDVSQTGSVVPRVSFRGPIEAVVSDEILRHLLSVLREALTNVIRHAAASRVDVVVIATATAVTLSVADDGVGMPDSPSAGNGLANIAARAEELGGELRLGPRSPSGTLLEWSVPTSEPQSR